eukprot:1149435-Pelagomonas_calceolata.AAC.6
MLGSYTCKTKEHKDANKLANSWFCTCMTSANSQGSLQLKSTVDPTEARTQCVAIQLASCAQHPEMPSAPMLSTNAKFCTRHNS